MSSVRRHAFVSGRVQGVWFRESTRRQAVDAGVCGFVRNLPDGRVECVLEGAAEDVDRVLAFVREGPELARVTDVDVRTEPFTGEFPDFATR